MPRLQSIVLLSALLVHGAGAGLDPVRLCCT